MIIEIPVNCFVYGDFCFHDYDEDNTVEVACHGGMVDAYHISDLCEGDSYDLAQPFFICISDEKTPNAHHCGGDVETERYTIYEAALRHLGVLRQREKDEYDETGFDLILDDFWAWVEFPCPTEIMPTSIFQVYENNELVYEGGWHDFDAAI